MLQKKSLRSYLLLLGIGVIWGGQFLFIAEAVENLPPTTITAARVLIGALTLSIVAFFLREEPLNQNAHRKVSSISLLIMIALFEVMLPLFLITWGQQHVASSVTAVIIGSVPIITLIFSIFMSAHKSVTIYSVLCMVLGFVGIIVLVNPSAGEAGANNLSYELAVFLGAMCFAISLNLMEKIPPSTPILSTRNMLWLAAVPLVLVSMVMDKPWSLTWTLRSVMSLILLGTLCSGLAYLMYTSLVQLAGSVFTSLSNFIVPLIGVMLGVTIRDEAFGPRQSLALALIIAALAANEMRVLVKIRS